MKIRQGTYPSSWTLKAGGKLVIISCMYKEQTSPRARKSKIMCSWNSSKIFKYLHTWNGKLSANPFCNLSSDKSSNMHLSFKHSFLVKRHCAWLRLSLMRAICKRQCWPCMSNKRGSFESQIRMLCLQANKDNFSGLLLFALPAVPQSAGADNLSSLVAVPLQIVPTQTAVLDSKQRSALLVEGGLTVISNVPLGWLSVVVEGQRALWWERRMVQEACASVVKGSAALGTGHGGQTQARLSLQDGELCIESLISVV